jgi:hypothetical protein
MADLFYNKGKFLIGSGAISTASDLRCLLVNTSYSPDPDHNFVSDVSANEISVSGYARQTLANKTITEDDTNDVAKFDADDVAFAGLTAGQTVGAAIVYRHNASDNAAELLGYFDLTNTLTNGGTINVVWAATGVWRIS